MFNQYTKQKLSHPSGTDRCKKSNYFEPKEINGNYWDLTITDVNDHNFSGVLVGSYHSKVQVICSANPIGHCRNQKLLRFQRFPISLKKSLELREESWIIKSFWREVAKIGEEEQILMLYSKLRLWLTSQRKCWWIIS